MIRQENQKGDKGNQEEEEDFSSSSEEMETCSNGDQKSMLEDSNDKERTDFESVPPLPDSPTTGSVTSDEEEETVEEISNNEEVTNEERTN